MSWANKLVPSAVEGLGFYHGEAVSEAGLGSFFQIWSTCRESSIAVEYPVTNPRRAGPTAKYGFYVFFFAFPIHYSIFDIHNSILYVLYPKTALKQRKTPL
jgi:hypothetical protein